MARRRRSGMTKREAQGIIALITALFLIVGKVIEYAAKAIGWGVQHVSEDVKWTSEGIRTHQGNWRRFYDQAFYKKVFKYIAVVCALAGLFLLFIRPVTGLIFLFTAGVSYFVDKGLFLALGRRAKEILVAGLIIAGLTSNYVQEQSEIEAVKRQQAELDKKERRELALAKKQAALLDSSNKLVELGRTAFKKKEYKRANALYDQALTLSPGNNDALYLKGLFLKEKKKYNQALALFGQVRASSEKYDEALVEQGLCLIKKGDEAQAVGLFKQASGLSNAQGEKLYNKHNPIRKRIIGYVTRCCDGSTSNASGRGACSHHGGVCDWNDPIYSETRKYE